MTTIEVAIARADTPAVARGVGVTLFVSAAPDPVFGVVLDVRQDAAGTRVVEVQLPDGSTTTRNATHVTPYVRPTPWWMPRLEVAA